MAGRFFNVDRADLASPHLIRLVAGRAWWRIAMVPGSFFRVPVLFAQLCGKLDCAAFAAAGLWLWRRRASAGKSEGLVIVGTMGLVFILFYALLVGEAGVRFVFPLYLAFVLICGTALSALRRTRPRTCWILLAAMLSMHGYSISGKVCVEKAPHYSELANFLLSNQMTRGYSDFLDGLSSHLPLAGAGHLLSHAFHPTFDERRPEYTRLVREAQAPVLVLDRRVNAAAIPLLESELARLNVSCKKTSL